VRRRVRGLEAAALVDRHVNQYRAGLHQRQLLAPHYIRGARAVDQHGADHEVGARQHLLDRQRGRVDGRAGAGEDPVELAQAVDRLVEDEDVGAHPDRDEGGVHADRAAADHDHVGRRHTGHAAEQDAAPAERLLQHEGAGLGGDLAGDLTHRRQQRQPSARVLDGLIGHAGGAGAAEAAGLLGVGREVQEREQQLAPPQHLDLGRLRLLHLQDHLRRVEHCRRVGRDPRALRLVFGVGDRAALARPGLDQDLVAVLGHLAHPGGGDRDAVLVGLDLPGDADDHRPVHASSQARSRFEPHIDRKLDRGRMVWPRSRARSRFEPHTAPNLDRGVICLPAPAPAGRARTRSGRGRARGRARSAPRPCASGSAGCGGGSRPRARHAPTARSAR